MQLAKKGSDGPWTANIAELAEGFRVALDIKAGKIAATTGGEVFGIARKRGEGSDGRKENKNGEERARSGI